MGSKGTFEGLDLALLIDAKHHSLVRRIELKPDHVAQLLDEKGIGRKLEATGAVRLQTEELKQAMDGALGNPGLFGDSFSARSQSSGHRTGARSTLTAQHQSTATGPWLNDQQCLGRAPTRAPLSRHCRWLLFPFSCLNSTASRLYLVAGELDVAGGFLWDTTVCLPILEHVLGAK
jgi:hypothetical protein